MEQTVRVRAVLDNGMAQVIRIRESACSGDCHKCAGCGAAQQIVVFEAVNAIGAIPGQTVTVRSSSGPVLAAAAVLYLMPVMMFFLGYLLGTMLWQWGALVGGIAFAFGIALAAVYDRKVVRKQKIEYTIIGYANGLDTCVKGDNDLD